MPPTLDERAVGIDGGGWQVTEVTEPPDLPQAPTYRVKGITLQPAEYDRWDGTVRLTNPISIYAHLEVYDGATLLWRWSAVVGDLVGP